MNTIGTPWLWAVFVFFVVVIFTLDVVILNGKRAHRVSTKESLGWTLTWVTCALTFNGLLWLSLLHSQNAHIADQKALEFLTGYLVEQTLSIDNMFVILMVFQFFCVPPELQRRVLLLGVLGAFVLRFIMIFFGVWLVKEFHWILYVFGVFLLLTGIKMWFAKEEKKDLSQNALLGWLKKNMRVTHDFQQENFFIIKNKLWYATPLFLALVFVELSDVIFALDSIPAIFGVTQDPFIIFTSNVFAILGLRSLYFLLANLAQQFHFLRYGVALILVFIGGKMLLDYWLHLPVVLSLSVIITVLLATILLSIMRKKRR